MEQNANAQTMLEWHYEENGERKGPVTDSAIKQLIQDGKLTYGNMVWKKGLPDWIKLENSDLKVHLDDNQPPPLSGEAVNNTVVWILAFAPIIGMMLEYFVAGLMHGENPGAEAMAASGKYWYITVMLNLGLSYYDEIRLRKAGHNTSKFKGMAWLIPVYLYQRAKALKQNLAYFIVWIICFVIILFA